MLPASGDKGNGAVELIPPGTKELTLPSKARYRRRKLPEYLSEAEVSAIIRAAPNAPAGLLMLLQWRAGLRIGEARTLRPADVHFDPPAQIAVRQGKGGKDRLIPLHAELAQALSAVIGFAKRPADEPLIGVSKMTAWRWYMKAIQRAELAGQVFKGRKIATHTFRHSAARHWIANGVPLNIVQVWLGHSNMKTTEIYTMLVSDPGGYMERVP